VIPLGKGEIKRPGKEITVLTYARMTYFSLEAARQLEEEGVDVEVIDLRTLSPLDFDIIAQSVKKTGRVVVAHEACLTGGFGGEIAARIGEELFDHLKAPVVRVGAKDVPVPFCKELEDYVLPQVPDVIAGINKALKR
jgi:pyruvate dehydrogenase E1 component beta subunit